MKFNRRIIPDTKSNQNFITKKRFKEDEIDFNKLRSYRLDRVKKELEKKDIKITFLPFLMKAVVELLQSMPEFNSSLNHTSEPLIIKQYHQTKVVLYLVGLELVVG